MKFEWDKHKNKLNFQKHKIQFEFAVSVFADSNRIVFYDMEHSEHEDRWITIGIAHMSLLYVVYTERLQGDVFRIISAR